MYLPRSFCEVMPISKMTWAVLVKNSMTNRFLEESWRSLVVSNVFRGCCRTLRFEIEILNSQSWGFEGLGDKGVARWLRLENENSKSQPRGFEGLQGKGVAWSLRVQNEILKSQPQGETWRSEIQKSNGGSKAINKPKRYEICGANERQSAMVGLTLMVAFGRMKICAEFRFIRLDFEFMSKSTQWFVHFHSKTPLLAKDTPVQSVL